VAYIFKTTAAVWRS